MYGTTIETASEPRRYLSANVRVSRFGPRGEHPASRAATAMAHDVREFMAAPSEEPNDHDVGIVGLEHRYAPARGPLDRQARPARPARPDWRRTRRRQRLLDLLAPRKQGHRAHRRC